MIPYRQLRFIIVLIVELFCLVASQAALAKPLSYEINITVTDIKYAKYYNEKNIEKIHLIKLIHNAPKSDISSKDINNIVSLLDMDDDDIRATAATCLSYIGPSASSAVPKLQKVLASVACIEFGVTSEVAVRRALVSMGVSPPKDACVPPDTNPNHAR